MVLKQKVVMMSQLFVRYFKIY